MIDIHGNCPECGKSWIGKDIPKKYHSYYLPPYKYSLLIGVEKQGDDCISSWQCPFCKAEWDRHTNKLIKKGD
jgi:predicted Zn-ribbon and HTH transcriptional regulator